MPLVGLWYRDKESGFAGRLFLLKVALALALLVGFLLSIRLWAGFRSYPFTPIIEGLPAVPPLVSWIWFGVLLLLLAAIIVVRRPRKYIIAFIVLAGLLSLLDQSRWQPWFYQYVFMFAALAVYPWREPDPEKREAALNACRLIVAGTYFWSGLQKLNVSFVEDTFPWLAEPLVALLPTSLEESVYQIAIAVPFIEAGIGVGLLIGRFRNAAVVLALGMHVFILFSIGPFGHYWNTSVWPWNVAMVIFVVILFWRTRNSSAKNILVPKTFFHGLVLLLFGIMPLFSFFGLWDSYLSASLYSGNTKSATVYVDDEVKNELPETVRDPALKGRANNANVLSISDWSWEELNVPIYPESRVFKNVARHVCAYTQPPAKTILVIRGKPAIVEGSREAEIYDCSGLETGEHNTQKLERQSTRR